ncbi:MAG TPA: hypothetical protein VM715_10575 [Candidatus Acidoferrum sp.]|nr:hypothetical protein [Candidatus Acidoferrum sp.]
MSVVQARIQTVEDTYRLVWNAVSRRCAIAATYRGRRRLLSPHRLGRNAAGEVRVLCYQYAGESASGLEPVGSQANWRCLELGRLSCVELREQNVWQTAPNHSRPASCVVKADIDAEDYPERDPQNGQ